MPPARIAIIGGGLAGLAAAVKAVEQGFAVELFEARRRLGGRAGSFCDPQSGEWVDHCQHVAMGCCTSLAEFCRRTGLGDAFERCRTLTFIAPDGRSYVVSGSSWLPPPLHLLPGLMRLGYLSVAERWGIIRAMGRLLRGPCPLLEQTLTVEAWLRSQGQTDRAIEQFWGVVLTSALGDTLDRASLAAARQVFVDGFLSSRQGYELEIPRVSLTEIYDRRLSTWLASHHVAVHLGTRIKTLEGDATRATAVALSDGSRRAFDHFILAVPWHQVRALVPEAMRAALPMLQGLDAIEASPITAVHLWFDRPIHALPHAVLVGRLSQWIFRRNGPGHGYQVVISGSHALRGRDRQEVVDEVLAELSAIWPAARQSQLLRWRMVTEPKAVFSVRPGLDRLRPPQQTPIPNLFLAGDWTSTGWPATMEGAVRSGNLAVEALVQSESKRQGTQ